MQNDLYNGFKADNVKRIMMHRGPNSGAGDVQAYTKGLRNDVERYRVSKSADNETMSAIEAYAEAEIARAEAAGTVELPQ